MIKNSSLQILNKISTRDYISFTKTRTHTLLRGNGYWYDPNMSESYFKSKNEPNPWEALYVLKKVQLLIKLGEVEGPVEVLKTIPDYCPPGARSASTEWAFSQGIKSVVDDYFKQNLNVKASK